MRKGALNVFLLVPRSRFMVSTNIYSNKIYLGIVKEKNKKEQQTHSMLAL